MVTTVIVGGSTIIALFCLPSLWRSRHSALKRTIWTLILFVPILGPVLYAGLFEPPPVKPESEQQEFDVNRHGG
jgi:hypothetical protein